MLHNLQYQFLGLFVSYWIISLIILCLLVLFYMDKTAFCRLCRHGQDCVFLSKTPADAALAYVKNVPFAPANYDDFLPKFMLPMCCPYTFCSTLM